MLIIRRKLKSISLYSFRVIFCSMFSLKISKHFFLQIGKKHLSFQVEKQSFLGPNHPANLWERGRSSTNNSWALLRSSVLFLEPAVKCSNCVVNSVRWGADCTVVPARGLAGLSWSLSFFVINVLNWREQKIWAHVVVWLGGQNSPFLREAAWALLVSNTDLRLWGSAVHSCFSLVKWVWWSQTC